MDFFEDNKLEYESMDQYVDLFGALAYNSGYKEFSKARLPKGCREYVMNRFQEDGISQEEARRKIKNYQALQTEKYGPQIHEFTKDGLAAMLQHVESLAGFDKDAFLARCLSKACRMAEPKPASHVVRAVLETGADPNHPDFGYDELFNVALEWHEPLIPLLNDCGADWNLIPEDRNWSVLHEAAHKLRYRAVKYFARLPNARQLFALPDSECDSTPLHAMIWSYFSLDGIFEQLIRHVAMAGVDISAADRNGDTPLHFAASIHGPRMVEVLLEYGADPNAQNEHGQSPLHHAAVEGSDRLPNCELLLKFGAQSDLKDAEGRTPADMAATPDVASLIRDFRLPGSSLKRPLSEA